MIFPNVYSIAVRPVHGHLRPLAGLGNYVVEPALGDFTFGGLSPVVAAGAVIGVLWLLYRGSRLRSNPWGSGAWSKGRGKSGKLSKRRVERGGYISPGLSSYGIVKKSRRAR